MLAGFDALPEFIISSQEMKPNRKTDDKVNNKKPDRITTARTAADSELMRIYLYKASLSVQLLPG